MSYRRSRSLGRYDDDSGDDRDTVKERKGGISSRTGAQRPSSKFTLPETFEVGSDQLSVQEVLDLYDRREITGDTKIIPAGFYPTILSLILKDLEGMALENGGRDDARSDRKQQETKRAPVKAGRDDTIEKRGSAEDDDNGPPLRRSMRGPFADDNRGQGVRNRGAPPRGPEDEDDIWAGRSRPEVGDSGRVAVGRVLAPFVGCRNVAPPDVTELPEDFITKKMATQIFQGPPSCSQYPNWLYVDRQGNIQGPFMAERMMRWYVKGKLKAEPHLEICGVTAEVQPPFLPGRKFFVRLYQVARRALQGELLAPLTPEDVKRGRPLDPLEVPPDGPPLTSYAVRPRSEWDIGGDEQGALVEGNREKGLEEEGVMLDASPPMAADHGGHSAMAPLGTTQVENICEADVREKEAPRVMQAEVRGGDGRSGGGSVDDVVSEGAVHRGNDRVEDGRTKASTLGACPARMEVCARSGGGGDDLGQDGCRAVLGRVVSVQHRPDDLMMTAGRVKRGLMGVEEGEASGRSEGSRADRTGQVKRQLDISVESGASSEDEDESPGVADGSYKAGPPKAKGASRTPSCDDWNEGPRGPCVRSRQPPSHVDMGLDEEEKQLPSGSVLPEKLRPGRQVNGMQHERARKEDLHWDEDEGGSRRNPEVPCRRLPLSLSEDRRGGGPVHYARAQEGAPGGGSFPQDSPQGRVRPPARRSSEDEEHSIDDDDEGSWSRPLRYRQPVRAVSGWQESGDQDEEQERSYSGRVQELPHRRTSRTSEARAVWSDQVEGPRQAGSRVSMADDGDNDEGDEVLLKKTRKPTSRTPHAHMWQHPVDDEPDGDLEDEDDRDEHLLQQGPWENRGGMRGDANRRRGPAAGDRRWQQGDEENDDIELCPHGVASFPAGGRQPGGRAGARPPGRDRADGPRGRDESVGGRAPRSVSRGRSYYDDEEEEEPPGRYSNGRSYGNRSNGHNGRGGWEEGGYDQRSRGYGNRNGNGRGGRGGGGGGGYGGGYGDRPYNSDYGGRGRGYGGGAGGNYGGGGGRFGGNRRY